MRATLQEHNRMDHGVVDPRGYINAKNQVQMLHLNLTVEQALGVWISESRDALRNNMELHVGLPQIINVPEGGFVVD